MQQYLLKSQHMKQHILVIVHTHTLILQSQQSCKSQALLVGLSQMAVTYLEIGWKCWNAKIITWKSEKENHQFWSLLSLKKVVCSSLSWSWSYSIILDDSSTHTWQFPTWNTQVCKKRPWQLSIHLLQLLMKNSSKSVYILTRNFSPITLYLNQQFGNPVIALSLTWTWTYFVPLSAGNGVRRCHYP